DTCARAQHPALPEGGLMTSVAAEARVPILRESLAVRTLRVAAKTPVHLLLVLVGALWLVPTAGLFLTSLLSASDFNNVGWWKVLAEPHLSTWHNYGTLIHETGIPHALGTTAEIAIGGTVLPILIGALAGYAFAWLDFPGRDWIFVAVIGMLVVPLQ